MEFALLIDDDTLVFCVCWLCPSGYRYCDAPRNGPKFSIPTFILGSCRVHYRNISSNITEGLTSASPCMLTTICFQFHMLNIYHLYGCHLKCRAIMHDEKLAPHKCSFFFACGFKLSAIILISMFMAIRQFCVCVQICCISRTQLAKPWCLTAQL
jgi:hypothetical protein